MSASLYSKLVSAAPMWLKESVHAEKNISIKTTFFFSSLHDHTSRAMMIMTAWLYCRLRRIHPMLWRHLDNPSVSKMFHEHFYHSPFDLIRWLQYSARSISQFPECPSEMNKLILTEMNNFEFEENDSSEIYGGEKKIKKSAAVASHHVHDSGERAQRLWVSISDDKRRSSFPPSARRWLTPLKAQRMNNTEMMEHRGSFKKQSCDTKGFITYMIWIICSLFHVVFVVIMFC